MADDPQPAHAASDGSERGGVSVPAGLAPEGRRRDPRHRREVRRQPGHRHRLDDRADRHVAGPRRVRPAARARVRLRRGQRAVRPRLDAGLPSITRKTDKGLPRYDDAAESDVFILSGAEDLVPVDVEDGGTWQREQLPARTVDGVSYRIDRYRPRIEGLFARIERWTPPRRRSRTGARSRATTSRRSTAGRREPRSPIPADPRRVFSWLICESYDDKGNAIVYEYKPEDDDGVDLAPAHERNRTPRAARANRYLKRIRYGNRVAAARPTPDLAGTTDWLFEVVFDYGEHDADRARRPDDAGDVAVPRTTRSRRYRAGFEVRTYRLCRRVLMFHHFPDEAGVGARLPRALDRPRLPSSSGADDARGIRSRPGVGHAARLPPARRRRLRRASRCRRSSSTTASAVDRRRASASSTPASLENLPVGLDGARYQWVDLDGEGVSGRPHRAGRRLVLQAATSATAGFGPVAAGRRRARRRRALQRRPAAAARPRRRRPARPRRTSAGRRRASTSAPTDGGWEPFRRSRRCPNVDWDDPNLRFVDLDRRRPRRRPDHRGRRRSRWYPSLGEDGFGAGAARAAAARRGARARGCVFADGTQSIYLADMSGDGLTDLVRDPQRRGLLLAEPRLRPVRRQGDDGRRAVVRRARPVRPAAHPPRRHRRLRHRPTSSTSARDGVRLYFNQSGNGWSAARRAAARSRASTTSPAVDVVDLLGNGTACLVWSSPLPGDAGRPLRYVDLMGGAKPHLLDRRAQQPRRRDARRATRRRRSSTCADKRAGRPWVTRLPFPVHVVERVETLDRDQPQPLRHPLRLPPRLLRRRRARVPRLRHGRAVGHRGASRRCGAGDAAGADERRRRVARAAGADPDLVPHRRVRRTASGSRGSSRTSTTARPSRRDAAERRAAAMLLADTVLPDTVLGRRRARTADPGGRARGVPGAQGLAAAPGGLRPRRQRRARRARTPSPSATTRSSCSSRPRANAHAVFLAHPRETSTAHYERGCTRRRARLRADPRVDARADARRRRLRQRAARRPRSATAAGTPTPTPHARPTTASGRRTTHLIVTETTASPTPSTSPTPTARRCRPSRARTS